MSALTVPNPALPEGCGLVPQDARSQFPANPWTGTDPKIVARVHQAIDATRVRPLPDLPPRATQANAPSDPGKWAANIVEAYRAAYVSTDGRQVEVFAVTFNDAKLATAPESLSAMLNPPRGLTARRVRGATVVRVSAPEDAACFSAVRAHIESLR